MLSAWQLSKSSLLLLYTGINCSFSYPTSVYTYIYIYIYKDAAIRRVIVSLIRWWNIRRALLFLINTHIKYIPIRSLRLRKDYFSAKLFNYHNCSQKKSISISDFTVQFPRSINWFQNTYFILLNKFSSWCLLNSVTNNTLHVYNELLNSLWIACSYNIYMWHCFWLSSALPHCCVSIQNFFILETKN